MVNDEENQRRARLLATTIEPLIGQVIFSPEAHAAYEALGFGASPATVEGVARPDGPAYFASRSAGLGTAPGEVVAATFAVFNPPIVVACINMARALTDPATMAEARLQGAIGQLTRILGEAPEGIDRAVGLLARATAPLRPEGRALFAAMLSRPAPGVPIGDLFHHGDLLREYRGDSHIAAWISAGFDATEAGLLAELYLGIPLRGYVRSRVWSDDELDAALARLEARGLVADDAFTDAGRAAREAVEASTDLQMRPAIEALGDDLDELIALLAPWAAAVVDAGGYLRSPADLAPA